MTGVVRTNPLPHVRHSHLPREAQARAGFQSGIPGSRTEEGEGSSPLPFFPFSRRVPAGRRQR